MNNVFKKLAKSILNNEREKYYLKLRKKLKNENPTIISSDCFGVLIYHNLGLRFNSPTINLTFSKEDFIIFVRDLKGFLSANIIEVIDENVDYPIGELEYNNRKIKIYFMHYETFEEAKEEWNKRKERVDFSNIFIIQLISEGVTEEDIIAFDNLPYKNKLLIADRNPINSPNVVVHKIFSKNDYKVGEILKYKTRISVKRHMDDIDYVSFLNKT